PGDGVPTLIVRLDEKVVSEPVREGKCVNWIGGVVMLPILIPLVIYGSHRFRPHKPDVDIDYTLVVSDERGVELARSATKVVIAIEEQSEGCEPGDPLAHSPHRAALDKAFNLGARAVPPAAASSRRRVHGSVLSAVSAANVKLTGLGAFANTRIQGAFVARAGAHPRLTVG